jgi:hypothetical protein
MQPDSRAYLLLATQSSLNCKPAMAPAARDKSENFCYRCRFNLLPVRRASFEFASVRRRNGADSARIYVVSPRKRRKPGPPLRHRAGGTTQMRPCFAPLHPANAPETGAFYVAMGVTGWRLTWPRLAGHPMRVPRVFCALHAALMLPPQSATSNHFSCRDRQAGVASPNQPNGKIGCERLRSERKTGTGFK